MANNLALSILITARDSATSVFNGIKNSLAGLGAAAAGLFGAAMFRGAIDDAQKLDEQMRKLEATIKATGGAAGVTAQDIVAMFAGEGNAVEFRDAAAQLLTFKSISKDVFESTLRLAEDLSANGFGDLSSNAVRLGKALEDPANGLTALTRVGVTFTDAEKTLVAQLVEVGDKAAAQGIILQAVAGQVGGVADAMEGGLAGSTERVDSAFRRIRETVGTQLNPALEILSSYIADVTEKLLGVDRTSKTADEATARFSGTAIFLAQAAGVAALNVDRLGRGAVALFEKMKALSTLDFSKIADIGAQFEQQNADGIKALNDQIDALQKPREINVKLAEGLTAAGTELTTVSSGVDNVVNQFKIWSKDSVAGVDNIATSLRSLSEKDLQQMKQTLTEAFDTGVNKSAELVKALDQIKTEEVARAWATLGIKSSASLQQSADAAKDAYVKIRDSGTATAKDLEAAWNAYIGKIRESNAAVNEADAAAKQRQQNLDEINSAGQTAKQQEEARSRQLTQETIDFEKAKNQGRLDDALRIAQEKEQLAAENAKAEAQAAAAGETQAYKAYDAKQIYIQAIKDTETALRALADAEKAATPGGDASATDKTQPGAADQAKANPQLQAMTEMAAAAQGLKDLAKEAIVFNVQVNTADALAKIAELSQAVDALNAKVGASNANAQDNTTNTDQSSVDAALQNEVDKRGTRV